ncbi:hypothetical protein OPT61_g8624 [Boeremia exigua]|uniref:Uncharacterized protein n=1 Tax=Boeremia exigua TaxID=749465 RepID=A0ACC2HXP7_9PLEO|nr:hypothetical protein OPT61_g8624 [Boeremia exigua]
MLFRNPPFQSCASTEPLLSALLASVVVADGGTHRGITRGHAEGPAKTGGLDAHATTCSHLVGSARTQGAGTRRTRSVHGTVLADLRGVNGVAAWKAGAIRFLKTRDSASATEP